LHEILRWALEGHRPTAVTSGDERDGRCNCRGGPLSVGRRLSRRKARAIDHRDWRAHVVLAAAHAGWNAPALAERGLGHRGSGQQVHLGAYDAARGQPVPSPLPIDRFIDYGLWVQRQVAPAVEPRSVERIDCHHGGFRLTFAEGEAITAAQVVVAAGIAPFAERPHEFDQLSPELASHSSDHSDLSALAGRSVAVVGAGQSALESAALLHEAGCDIEVLARVPRVLFLRRQAWIHQLGPLTRLMFAPAEVGPAGLSRLVAVPGWYRRLPRVLQDRFATRSLRPAGAAWLIPRTRNVLITSGVAVTGTTPMNGSVRLTLDDGSERCVA
jgi:FAD-dependent urate hydroxylase